MPDEVKCINYAPCTELPVCLRNVDNTDPVEGIQDENICIEDIPGLSIDPDDLDEDGIVD